MGWLNILLKRYQGLQGTNLRPKILQLITRDVIDYLLPQDMQGVCHHKNSSETDESSSHVKIFFIRDFRFLHAIFKPLMLETGFDSNTEEDAGEHEKLRGNLNDRRLFNPSNEKAPSDQTPGPTTFS